MAAAAQPEEEELSVLLGATYRCKRKDGTYRDAQVVKFRMNKRAGREEYLAHYAGLTRRQAEWVDKTRLMLSGPVKEDDTENGADQKKVTAEESVQNPRSEEDEPETKKVKVDTSVVGCKDQEITCTLCNELCEDLVMDECGHSFCSSCIDKALDPFSCPDCKKVLTEKKSTINLALANTSQTSASAAVTITAAKPFEKVKAQPFVNCPDHDEKLKLYCKDDGALACVICRDSLKHSGHKFLPVVDAVEVYQAELPTVVRPLEECLREASELTTQQREKIEQLQNTIIEYQQHIMSEFGNLYSFLKDRKEKLLEQLQEQNQSLLEKMENNAAKMKDTSDTLKETIAVAKQKVDETDLVYFLDGVQDFIKKCQEQHSAVTSSSKNIIEKQLCPGDFNGPIQYIAWKQMKSVVPVPECEQQPVPPRTVEVPEGPVNHPFLKESEHPNPPDEIKMECEPVPLIKEEVLESPMNPPLISDSNTEYAEQATPPEERKMEYRPVKPAVLKASEAKEIWIVGDVFMNAVNRRAESGPLGLNLGFIRQTCTLRWLGLGKHCYGLYSRLKVAKNGLKMPNIIFLHACIGIFESQLRKAEELFPNTVFILSTLLPNPELWNFTLELRRKEYNAGLRKYAEKPLFHFLTHEQLEKMLTVRYLAGNEDPLTDAEADLFLTSIRDALQKAMCENFSPVIEQCRTLSSAQSATRTKEIWIVGNGFMIAAKSRAETGPLGLNLGLDPETCKLRWWSQSDTWFGLLPKLRKSISYVATPDIIFFHSGSKDLDCASLTTLINCARACFLNFARFYPCTKFILSTLLPKPQWQRTYLECRLRNFNAYLRNRAKKRPFYLLTHDELQQKLIDRYAAGDGSPLTEAEADLFLTSFRDSIKKLLFQEDKSSVVKYVPPLPSRNVVSQKVQSAATAIGPDQASTGKEVESAVTKPKEIWIIGNSYIFKASLRAENGDFGRNFGFAEQQWKVRWMGKTLRWFSVLKDMHNASRTLGMPSIVYLHVGSNDLGVTHYGSLIEDFTYDIGQLVKLYPKTRFIFSIILPRTEWLCTPVEESRKRFNTSISVYAKKCGFEVVSNSKLEEVLLKRFHGGRVFSSLTHLENDIFLTNIRFSLQQATLKGSQTVSTSINRFPSLPRKEVLSTGGTLIVVVPSASIASTEEDKEAAEEEETLGMDPAASTEEDQEAVEEEETFGTDPAASTEEDQEALEERETLEYCQPVTSEEIPGGSDPPADFPLPNNSEVKRIWIVGNSYICRAARQANSNAYGFNLGFEPKRWNVHWMGRVSMRWEALLAELNNALSTLGEPSIIFIHLGDNDVGCVPYDTLTKAIEDDLSQITTQFPKTEFVFSTVLPRAEWLTNPQEQSRQAFNNTIVRYAEELGFHAAVHEDIEETAIPRFKSGGSTVISDSEYDLFVKDIRDALEKIVLKVEGSQTV